MAKKTLLICFLGLLLTHSVLSQSPTIIWYYDVDDMAFGNTALADLTGNGLPEIVFSTYRNDGHLYVLKGDGTLLWKYDVGGCSDAAPLIIDADGDGDLDIILASSCNPKTFCFDGDSGYVHWVTNMRGSDSPPSAADLDGDGKLEILHGQFGGYVLCLNAEDGSVAWELPVDLNSWIQTAPAILDVNNDGVLDFVVANWSFGTNHKIWAFRGTDRQLLWESSLPGDVMYHGASFADIDKDGLYELTIGSYDGKVYCLNAATGSLKWDYSFQSPFYVGAPTSIGDLDNDGWDEVVFFDGWKVGVLDHTGWLKWSYTIPAYGQAFRGAALADLNGDDTLDVIFGTSKGQVIVLSGGSGNLLYTIDLRAHHGSTNFDIDHGPVVADLTGDGKLEVFVVGGHAEYPAITNNYGRAYAISFPASNATEDPNPWPMFRHDIRRSGHKGNLTAGLQSADRQEVKLRVYPNPAQGDVNIRLQPERAIQGIKLFDMMGRCIGNWTDLDGRSSHNIALPAPGMYLISVYTSDAVIESKVLNMPR